jgi:hypothetical protein
LRDIVRAAAGGGGAESLPPGLAAFSADAARDPIDVDPQLHKAFELLNTAAAHKAARARGEPAAR